MLIDLGRPDPPMAFTITANTIEASVSQSVGSASGCGCRVPSKKEYTLSNTSFRLDTARLNRGALLVCFGAEICQTHRDNPPRAQNENSGRRINRWRPQSS